MATLATSTSALLRYLERPIDTSETMAQCLRGHDIPASSVVQLLQPARTTQSSVPSMPSSRVPPVNRDELRHAYTAILSSYFVEPLQHASGTSTAGGALTHASDTAPPPLHSTMWVQRVATMGTFLQLLLEFRESTAVPPLDAMARFESNDGITETNPSQSGDVQICSMITETIRAVTGAVCQAATATRIEVHDSVDRHLDVSSAVKTANQQYKTLCYDYTAVDAFPMGQILCMAFGTLQRLDTYCTSRPFLLSVLWKSLCEIAERASACHTLIPSPLIHRAIVSLTHLIHQGLHCLLLKAGQTAASRSIDAVAASDDTMTWKILIFVVMRLTTLVKVPTACVTRTLSLETTLGTLATVRGFVESTTHPPELTHRHTLATKIDNVMAAWMQTLRDIGGETDGIVHQIHKCEPPPNETDATNELSEASFYVGKVLFLNKVLGDALSDPTTDWSIPRRNESFLLVMEELLLRSLPAAVLLQWDNVQPGTDGHASHVQRLLGTVMQSISDTLLRIEISTSAHGSTCEWQKRLDRLLVYWLNASSHAQHALCRELVLTVVQRRIGFLSRPSSDDTPCPFLVLIVGLLVDARTITPLRSCLSSLLTRLLLDPTMKPTLERLLTNELAGIGKATFGAKVSNFCLDNEDMAIVLQIADNLQCGKGEERLDGIDRGSLSPRMVHTMAISVARSHYSSEDALTDALDAFLKVWKPRRYEELSLVACSLLLQVRRCCHESVQGQSDRATEAILRFLIACTEPKVLETAVRSKMLCAAVFEAIRVLGRLACRLRASTPRIVVDQLASCFHAALSSKHWVVRELSLASLVEFASTVPSTHDSILPSCVPKAMRKALQCRIRGVSSRDTAKVANQRASFHRSLLSTLDPRPGRGSTIFPALSSTTVARGSYIVRMSTRDGRSAVVIFPPGSDSLGDIHHMRGGNDDDESVDDTHSDIETVKHTSILSDGTCQIQSAPLD